MKKVNLVKGLIVSVLSIVLVVSFASIVLADNTTDGWDEIVVENNTVGTNNINNTLTPATSNTNTTGTTTYNTTNTTNVTNTTTNLSTNNTTNNTSKNNTTNNTNKNVNSLAHTGIEDNSVLAVVIALGIIVSAYLFKKVKEYNNL